MQPGVLGLMDHPHPATAELFNDAIMRDGFTDHRADAMVGRVVGASQRIHSVEELNQVAEVFPLNLMSTDYVTVPSVRE